MKNILRFIFIFSIVIISTQVHSQSKITIVDTENILSETTDSLLIQKFARISIEYVIMIDPSSPCDYYYVNLFSESNATFMNLSKCNNSRLGSMNLGSEFSNLSSEDAASIIFMQCNNLIYNPEQTAANQASSSAEISALSSKSHNQHSSRYFFSPSSYNLKKGELYYNTVYLLLHDVQYGITDNFSLGMGTTVGLLPFYVTPKYSFYVSDFVTVAVGDMFVIGTWGLNMTSNLLYSTMTLGDEFSNVTLGLGYFWMGAGNLTTNPINTPVLNLSGMIRFSPSIYAVSENYLATYTNQSGLSVGEIQHYPFIGLTGFRFVSKKSDVRAISAGLAYYYDINGQREVPLVLPGLSFTYKFGKLM